MGKIEKIATALNFDRGVSIKNIGTLVGASFDKIKNWKFKVGSSFAS